MNCPNDGETLLMTERQGVEIDYCPKCRGVWLDRGELDKILEQAKAESAPQVPHAQPAPEVRPAPQQAPRYDDRSYSDRGYGDRRDSRDPRYNDPRYSNSKYRKKKSPFEFLGDLFEG